MNVQKYRNSIQVIKLMLNFYIMDKIYNLIVIIRRNLIKSAIRKIEFDFCNERFRRLIEFRCMFYRLLNFNYKNETIYAEFFVYNTILLLQQLFLALIK